MKKSKDRFACRDYREFITLQPCARCGGHPCDPCHEISRKWADGSDALCIPLCRGCHRLFDNAGKGKVLWLKERGIEIGPLQITLWRKFLRSRFNLDPLVLDLASFEEFLEGAGLREIPYSKRKNRVPKKS